MLHKKITYNAYFVLDNDIRKLYNNNDRVGGIFVQYFFTWYFIFK